ncbi:ribonuclease R [Deinococcus cavernae]|nr:ribonuclease R [Deinococcus cavernae]
MPRVKKQDAAPEAKASASSSPKKKKSTSTPADAVNTNEGTFQMEGPESAPVATTPRATKKKTATKTVAVELPAEAKKASRGRKARAEEVSAEPVSSEPQVAEEPVALKSRSRTRKTKVAEVPVMESQADMTSAQPEVNPEGVDRQPQMEALVEATPELAEVIPPKPARKGRKPKAEAIPVAEVGEPIPAPVEATPEPVILEVPRPKATRGRKPKAAKTAEMPADLPGVQSVAVELETPALAITHTTKESFVDSPAAFDEEYTPAPQEAAQPSRKNRKPKRTKETAQAAEPEPVEPEREELPDANPEQDILIAQLRKLGRPVHVRDLEKTFTRQTLERLGGWRNLTDLLEELVEAGQVIRTRKKTYGLPDAMSLVRGRFQASQAGFGFVIPDSGGEDYYVPADKTMEAWNGDIVLVRMEGRGDTRDNRGGRRGQKGDGNPRASVVRIVQRAYRQLVGTLEFQHGHPILKPDDHRARHRILLLPDGLEELEGGARVVTELFWPETTGEDEVFGQVTRVLGTEDDPFTETEAVIVKYKLRGDFPDDVLAQAEAVPVEIPEEALVGRLDLRDFNIFTVDGRDAKDFDDAIHIQPVPDGNFVVGVHIADVSHYVKEGTPLDQEAYARATSVYLPGRVLPMLPEHLSNGVCSLVPHQDRLTMTALVELSPEGDILDVKLAPSVINSKARLTYDEVQAYSEATATLPEHARHLEGDLHLLLKITTKLRQKRLREGSLDFKLREVKVDVGPDGRMELIPIREETARGMIEDLMLLANKVVAQFLLQRDVPTLFRIHEEPTLQRFQDVSQAIGRLGFAFPGGEPTPQAYQAVLKQVRGTHRESVVNTLLLRSMQQAKYAGENLGHFGLAFDDYLHFTSPIRRYPDLVVHRTLKAVQSGEFKAGNRNLAQFQARLPGMGEHTSDRERAAAEAERDLTKYYQCKWAQEHLCESFQGNVSGVVASGLYVALDNGVEGKLHISHLDDDYYVFIEDAQMLKGRRSGKSFRLGDPVGITIQDVKPLARQIDLVLADPTDPEYKLGQLEAPQENSMDTETPVKPRARRREDREAEHREKLQKVQVSAPRKFTLDDPSIQTSPQSGARPSGGGYTRSGQGQARNEQRGGGRGGRQGSPTFGGVSMGEGGQGRSGGGSSRRVITLERPRNEHLRPVNITVQRMYFGDWTTDNLPPDEGPSQARAGRERGYSRYERGEGGGRGWTRGNSDRGAVRHLNGRSGQQGGQQGQGSDHRPAPAAAQAQPAQAQATQTNGTASSDDAKRRRRRRGRRNTGSAPTE